MEKPQLKLIEFSFFTDCSNGSVDATDTKKTLFIRTIIIFNNEDNEVQQFF